MGDFVHSKDIPKKYYRYFLKGLAYYTCQLNKACTLADLQAYVFLKSLQQLSEADLTYLTHEIMGNFVSTGLANNQNGYYRLNDLLRFAHGSSSKQVASIDHTRDTELSSGSGLRKIVNFSNTVTMWPTDTLDGVGTISGTVSNPTLFFSKPVSTMDQEDIENPSNKTDTVNESDSDKNDKDNGRKTTETNPSTSQAETKPDTEEDSDSSHTIVSDDDADDEESGIAQKTTKQEPDPEPINPEKSENDIQKQE